MLPPKNGANKITARALAGELIEMSRGMLIKRKSITWLMSLAGDSLEGMYGRDEKTVSPPPLPMSSVRKACINRLYGVDRQSQPTASVLTCPAHSPAHQKPDSHLLTCVRCLALRSLPSFPFTALLTASITYPLPQPSPTSCIACIGLVFTSPSLHILHSNEPQDRNADTPINRLCPMLNGTMKPEDIQTGFGSGAAGGEAADNNLDSAGPSAGGFGAGGFGGGGEVFGM